MVRTVEGVTISGYGHQGLARDLEIYCEKSAAARAHVIAAHAAGATIEIQKAGQICHADGTVVKVSRDACLDKATGLTSPIYLVESVLFELQNAINSQRYKDLKRNVSAGAISLLKYGVEYCKTEFEATAKVVSILTQIRAARLPISPWGSKQFEGCHCGAAYFANQPHDPDAANYLRLPSKLLYPYEYVNSKNSASGLTSVLWKVAVYGRNNRQPTRRDFFRKISDSARGESPVPYLVAYIEALSWLANEQDCWVKWNDGTRQDWKLCAIEFGKWSPGADIRRLTGEIKGIVTDLARA